MSARDELAAALHSEGAYCGNCGFDGLALCLDCRIVLGRYADRLIGDGWVKMPSRGEIGRVLIRAYVMTPPTMIETPKAMGCEPDDGTTVTERAFLVDPLIDAIVALLAGETS